MGKVIAIISQKGGVGKSATAINLASSLSRFNNKVLLIDMDPQGNASKGYGIDTTQVSYSIFDVLKKDIDIFEATIKTDIENVYIVPSKLALATIDSITEKSASPLTMLKRAISKIKDHYDYVIIDCPPSVSFLTENCLVAANSILIPIQCEPFSFDATSLILSKVLTIQNKLNPSLDIEGFLLTMYDERMNICNDIATEVRTLFKENLFSTFIPRSVSIPESNYRGMPLCAFRPNSKASIAYLSLAREIIDNQNKKSCII